ncbi:MAG: glycosyltransferase family 39 protein [Methylobacillus sp.]|jgi:hypothetical protein|nr:glycosyltransferase family 39 protein [Methylobacillus sp.]
MSFPKLDPNRLWIPGVVAIFLLAATLFGIAVTDTHINGPIRGDARDYYGYAYNLKFHGVYSRELPGTVETPTPDALRSPGYPAAISILVDKTDAEKTLKRVVLLQAVLGVLTVLAYLALFRRFMPPVWALGAGIVTAISPHLVNASVYLLSETLFTFLLGVHLFALERALRLRNIRWFLIAGILLALSFLARPTTQFLLLAYVAIVVIRFRKDWRIYGKYLLWLALPAVITFAGWSARNEIAIGRMSDPTLSANFIQHGMYPNLMYNDEPGSYAYPYRFDPRNAEISGKLAPTLEIIADNFQQQPRRYLSWYLIGKPLQFFAWHLTESDGDVYIYEALHSPYRTNDLFKLTHDVAAFLHPFMICLSLLGIYIAIKRKNPAASLFGVALLYFVALHMIGAPFPRYSIPVRPINYGLAFYAVYQMALWLKTKSGRAQ